MSIKPKIKISEEAYNKLIELINKSSEKKYVKFAFSSKCCGGKVSISIDEFCEGDIKDNIENLHILYDNNIVNNINEITLVYRDSKFLISFKELESLDKGDLVFNSDGEVSSTNKCGKGCGGCNSSCSKCSD